MRNVKAFGLVLVALSALSAALATAALAAEAEILNPGAATTKDNGVATLESAGGGIVVKCTSSEGFVKPVPLRETTNTEFDELFLGCTAGGFKCTGFLDFTTGSILVRGEGEIVAVKVLESIEIEGKHVLLNVLHAVEIFTIEEVQFSCLGVTTKVSGSVVGKVDDAAGEKTTKLLVLLVGSKGKNEITKVNNGEHHLQESTAGGAFTEASLNQNVTATSETPGHEVEVMY